MIFFTSDLHLMHSQPFLFSPRGYKDTYSMSEDIIKNINEVVGVEDELYLLGDLMLNDNEAGRKLLAQIKCHNIHIILGNHDTDERIAIYKSLWNVVEVCYATRLRYGKWTFLLSHYPTDTWNFNNGDKKLSQVVWNLCGHRHVTDKYFEMKKGLAAYHVELDAHETKPISIEQVIEDIKQFYKGE